MTTDIKVKLLPGGSVPQRKTTGAAGYDLSAARLVTIAPGAIGLVPCGFCIELPDGMEAQIRPRSGLASGGKMAMFGTIDSDYRGEVAVVIANFTNEVFRVEAGDRIAQMVVAQVAPTRMVVVNDLSPTERGDRGFGSTGGSATLRTPPHVDLNSGTDS